MHCTFRRPAFQNFPVWSQSDASLALPAQGEAHIWALTRIDCGIPESDLWGILSADERDALRQIGHPTRRQQKAMSRAVLRRLLSAYLGLPGSAFRFVYSAHGKPSLVDPGIGKLRFNLSHSGSIALFAFSVKMEIGVDVEPLERKHLLGEPSGLLSDAERASWGLLPDGMREGALLAAWVRKEAMAKALGRGLSLPLTRLALDGRDKVSKRRLAVFGLDWPPGHLSAVAATGGLRCLRLGAVASFTEVGRPS